MAALVAVEPVAARQAILAPVELEIRLQLLPRKDQMVALAQVRRHLRQEEAVEHQQPARQEAQPEMAATVLPPQFLEAA